MFWSHWSVKGTIFLKPEKQRVKIEDVTGQAVNEQRSFKICRNNFSERLSSGGGEKEGERGGGERKDRAMAKALV